MPSDREPGYFLSRAAERDLDLIWDYTSQQWGISQADTYLRRIHAALARLPDFPGAGHAVDEIRQGYRVLPIEARCAFYRTMKDGIEVVRILHGRMDARGKFAAAKQGE
ncbi:type II toxin-antitoxin system RelE/ParE family toxin [Maricaulis sp.]|uniref:type II toxin-antitoxin system RelE/ParE family toxin n=1 Tax=Maricaulis sp. TaxID=1486257 RepID=UPI003A8E46B1